MVMSWKFTKQKWGFFMGIHQAKMVISYDLMGVFVQSKW